MFSFPSLIELAREGSFLDFSLYIITNTAQCAASWKPEEKPQK